MVYFKVFNDFIGIAEELDDAARGRLFLAVLQYVNGQEVIPLAGGERIAFLVLKAQIDREQEAQEARAEINRENGRRGGRPKTDPVIDETEKTQMVTRQSEKTLTKNKNKNKTNNKDNSNTSSFEDEFDALWALYPRKQGRQAALKAYSRDRKNGASYDAVKAGIEAYVNYIRAEGTEDRFIKQGSTFFNQAAWQDQWIPGRRTKGGITLLPESEREEAVF